MVLILQRYQFYFKFIFWIFVKSYRYICFDLIKTNSKQNSGQRVEEVRPTFESCSLCFVHRLFLFLFFVFNFNFNFVFKLSSISIWKVKKDLNLKNRNVFKTFSLEKRIKIIATILFAYKLHFKTSKLVNFKFPSRFVGLKEFQGDRVCKN